MSSIVTITFSPCIDKSTSIPFLISEKKLKCTSPKLEPGGGGINIARAIKKLGSEAMAIFPSGGYTGQYFNYLMEKENIATTIIATENETRENIIVFEEATGKQYRFGMPGTELKESEWKQCLDAIAQLDHPEFIIASGSLPPGMPQDIYARVAKIAKNKNAKFIVDTSGDALKYAAKEGVYLLKPNLEEFRTLTGVKDLNITNLEEVAGKYILNANCSIIVISLGENGAFLITKNEQYKVHTPIVDRNSTVGAGDSMLAGIVLGLSQGLSLKETLQYGVACGTAATMNPGTELCHKTDAEKLFKEIRMNAPVHAI